ncbi:MAG: YraN family protein [Clostridia bacterium]|nr:YraN family protein [Clostridia bacterium]
MQNSPKNLYKKLLGLTGEKIAVKQLKKQGYKVILTNYVTPFGEADIVCKKGETLVFAEVKTRTSSRFGTPAEAVDYKKQKKYRDIATYYLKSKGESDVEVSFLVVEVMDGSVNIITDAF